MSTYKLISKEENPKLWIKKSSQGKYSSSPPETKKRHPDTAVLTHISTFRHD